MVQLSRKLFHHERIRELAFTIFLTKLPGVKSAAKHATTPTEALETFFTEEMLQLIVEYTNLEIQRIRGKYSRERNANPTNIVELKAVIGLLFLAGLLRSYHVNAANL